MLVLTDLTAGENARISGFLPGDKITRKKLLSLGLTLGTPIAFERKAPLGDPLQIKVRGYVLSLRASEARLICVEKIS